MSEEPLIDIEGKIRKKLAQHAEAEAVRSVEGKVIDKIALERHKRIMG
jgi:hypothetical protein